MGMRVFFRGTPVRGPARVADAVRAVDRRLPDGFFQIVQFSRGAADMYFTVQSDYRDASRVIASIFQTPQAVQDKWNDFLWPDVSDNSAHGIFSGR
jgi:hypothetical protein